MVKNLTVGNPLTVILVFTIPLFFGNLFQQSYNIFDTYIVGRTIGLGALASVGSTGSINFLILGFINGFGIGAAVITSQRFGAGDIKGVKKSFAATIIISIGLAVVLTFISVLSARPLLEFLQTPAEIIDNAHIYIITIFWGIPTAMFFNLFANILRAVGDSRTPLYFLGIACILNILLDLFFILVLKKGLRAVALATVISQFAAGSLCLVFIIKKMPILHITSAEWRIDLKEITSHLKIALPVGFQMSIIAIGSITVTYALNQLGTSAVTAFTAANRIDVIAFMLLMSFGGAMTTYTAQNYGARQIGRIRKGIAQVSIIAVIYCVTIALVFLFSGYFFPGIFLGWDSIEILSMAHTYLIINSSFYILLAMLFIIRQSLLGLGDSVTPTIAGIMELVMRIFAAIILGRAVGFTGICWANPLAWAGALVPLVIAFVIRMKKLNF
ncbi:MAG: MATE family efflux transporter [Treponema sp.]|nr:MATE family efflux transporter [Treponema sp.]MCL2272341.1 MATE family efflux transporter [Treponema sp.]